MKVLLTGATGFLGHAVAGALRRHGHELRVLARGTSSLAGLPEGAETVLGDVTDAASFAQAASGCGAILHLAALVKVWVSQPEQFDEVNVGGVRNAIAAARSAGARLVYTSSFMALGPSGEGERDAAQPHPGPPFRNAYERTKAAADRLAREAAASGQDVLILYPGVIYGPGEMTDGNIVVRLVADHLNGRLPALIGPADRRWSYAFVEDVAEGHVAALESGHAGERFVLAGENETLAGLFARVEGLTGCAPPRHRLPFAAASAVGWLQWLWAELTGHPPQLTPGEVGVFRQHWACDSSGSQARLGYRSRPLAQGLEQTIDWLRREGLVPSVRVAA